ncbi:MAG: hypothetical protein CL878_08015 [Dehalococcoidia bacterium]|nr:hypothetical protein [Dehalococcoidia bacterium]
MAASSRPLRIGVAGVGSFTQRVILPGLAACADAELVALFGPSREKTDRIAAEYGVHAAFDDYAALLAHSPLDAVLVATPNDAHHPMAMAALKRNLAVACEKPLALTTVQAREMLDTARQRGAPTAVNFSYRSSTPYRQIAQLLAEGQLGSIYHFSVLFLQGIKADPDLPLAWRMQAGRGGGTVLDIGTHMLDLLRWWFGDIAAVCAHAKIVVGERTLATGGRAEVTADDTASCLLQMQNGLTGLMQLSQVAHGRETYRHIALYGSAGSVVAIDERNAAPKVRVAKPGGNFATVPPSPQLHVAYDDYPAFHLARIVRTLKGENTDFPTFVDGLRAQEAAEAIQESSEQRQWVELPRSRG